MNYRVNVPSLAVIDIPVLRPQDEAFALICACVNPNMLIDVKLLHLLNAFSPMLDTELGIVIDVKLSHS